MLGGNDLLLKLEKNNFNCTKEELKKFEQKSDFESKQILRSLGTKWYKCPKGHLYVVGECGRPTEKSICPECGSSIGGINHVPERGNSSINIDNAF
jgi:rRNA maturation protein Nop10